MEDLSKLIDRIPFKRKEKTLILNSYYPGTSIIPKTFDVKIDFKILLCSSRTFA